MCVCVSKRLLWAVWGGALQCLSHLIVGRRENPRMFVMKLHSANVVEMTEQREETTTLLVVPDLDLVVVTARHKQRLRRVEAHATHRAYTKRHTTRVSTLHTGVVERCVRQSRVPPRAKKSTTTLRCLHDVARAFVRARACASARTSPNLPSCSSKRSMIVLIR